MMFVIWSFEHNQWWGPSRRGYVDDLALAGRYGWETAGDIVTSSALLDEVAVPLCIAERFGQPKHHPYGGDGRGAIASKVFK